MLGKKTYGATRNITAESGVSAIDRSRAFSTRETEREIRPEKLVDGTPWLLGRKKVDPQVYQRDPGHRQACQVPLLIYRQRCASLARAGSCLHRLFLRGMEDKLVVL